MIIESNNQMRKLVKFKKIIWYKKFRIINNDKIKIMEILLIDWNNFNLLKIIIKLLS
jgi:hypothetical protein